MMKEVAEQKFTKYKQIEAKQDTEFDDVVLKVIESKSQNKKKKK